MTEGSLYFDADGRFRSVDLAAQHAVIVQGGFTTPAIEAERMSRERGDSEQAVYYREMGRRWLEEHK